MTIRQVKEMPPFNQRFLSIKVFKQIYYAEFLLECGTLLFSDGYLFFIYFQKIRK